jgi:NitT/TauT family transport system ATP-binding protein
MKFTGLRFANIGVDFETSSATYRAIKDVSFEIEEGKVTCIIGPSGCGKSTMLNLVGGFIKPTRGDVAVIGGNLSLAALRKAFVFQDYALFPWRTALGNVKFGLEVLRLSRSDRQTRATEALRSVNLDRFADFYPHKLSGGMKQRVSVARALAFDPDVLLMDEPFAALDEEMREDLQGLVLRIWQQTKKTILYITHSISEAVFLADRVIVLSSAPGEVSAIIDIDLVKPRDRLGDVFRDYEKQLVALVRKPAVLVG